ncbi:MAG: deaminated glutathione amidase [Candidatus Binatota bacterium]|nr:deaminated glutathione amidase [Candidatus Binatota bacterium]
MFLAAAVQMSSGPDKEANLEKAERLVRQAASLGAELVVLPEVVSVRARRDVEGDAAESIPGPTSERFARLARELRIHLQSGSILERIEGERRSYNTALLFSPEGECLARYRKIHLFDVEIPGQVTARESESRMPGREVVTAPTPLGTIGLSVCYDLRFPELYRRLARAGAEIVTIPSAFTMPTGAAHWETLVRARAIENQVYVIAPDQYGVSPHGHRDWGSSMIVDPWGTVVARAREGENVVIGAIDLEYLAKVRRELPCLTHAKLET